MERFSELIRRCRIERKLPLRIVAASLDIDQAILSKIETGRRKATRIQVSKFAEYFNLNLDDLLVRWLSENLVYELKDEENAIKALEMAEEIVAYQAFKKVDHHQLISRIKEGIGKFTSIEKAWIYGSFSRGDDGPGSDIDIALKTMTDFTYFDLAEVQFQLELIIGRKIDVGFIDSFKPYIFEHVKPDLKLIYEK